MRSIAGAFIVLAFASSVAALPPLPAWLTFFPKTGTLLGTPLPPPEGPDEEGVLAERDPELHRRWLRDTSVTPPRGESFDSVSERVRRSRDRIIAEHSGTTVLVVSHVTPIKTLLRIALDAGPAILYRLHLDLASLSIAEFYPDGASSVRLVNQTAYL